jgi:hypothetical protein
MSSSNREIVFYEKLQDANSVRTELGHADDSLRDLAAYPVLTEELGYPPAPITGGGGGGAYPGAPGKSGLGQSAAQAISDVLGWRANPGDAAGFVGALTQSFTLSEEEGRVEATWKPRSYAVQTDLAGGITGAQASLLFRMKDAVDQSLPLIDGLTPLRRDPDWEYITAAKAVVKSQLQELIAELSLPGSLRVVRVDQIFRLLFEPALVRATKEENATKILDITIQNPGRGRSPLATKGTISPDVETDPDFVGGQLGELRLQLGLRTLPYEHKNAKGEVIRREPGNLVNTVDDETDETNYRMVVDYLSSIWISWLLNRQYFVLPNAKSVQPFFGTQLVLISRALSVVAEKVGELRFALDSVFIGQAERQALELRFPQVVFLLDGEEEEVDSDAMFLEDLLNWVASFATDEGPRLIQTAGRYGVKDSFYPVARSLAVLVQAARDAHGGTVPGFKTARVRRAIDELSRQLQFLTSMVKPIQSPIQI